MDTGEDYTGQYAADFFPAPCKVVFSEAMQTVTSQKAPDRSTTATRCALHSLRSLQCLRRLVRRAVGPFQSRPCRLGNQCGWD